MKNIERTSINEPKYDGTLNQFIKDFLYGNDDALRDILKFIFSIDPKKLS